MHVLQLRVQHSPGQGDHATAVCDEYGALVARKGGKVARVVASSYQLQVSTTPAKVIEVMYLNEQASQTYLQIHDAAASPDDAVEPLAVFQIPANGWGIIPWEEVCAKGIYLCASTDSDTKTIEPGRLMQIYVRYEDVR